MTAANHHYVPQFVLREFRQPGTGKLAAYDKNTQRLSYISAKKAAQTPGFNARSDGTDDIERQFGAIENAAAGVVRQIVRDGTPAGLSANQIDSVRELLICQTFRSPRQRRVNSLMVRATPALAAFGELSFDESAEMTRDSQLRVTAAYIRMWRLLGPARWPMGVMALDAGTDDEFLVPDNGCVSFHPEIRAQGWVDAPLNEMGSVVMAVSPKHVVFVANPDFSSAEAVPGSPTEFNDAAFGVADRYIYGRIGGLTLDRLRTLRLPDMPEAGAPLP